jgi:hypothetical protein
MKWRIYYDNGSTFDSLQGEPEQAPSIGVICIKHFIENEWRIQAFTDYYIREKDEWWGADAPGFWQYMFRPGFKVVKFGTNIKDEPFQKIVTQAREDTDGGMPRIV